MKLDALGSLLLVGLSGPELRDDERRLLSELSPCGIILFRKNVDGVCGDGWMERFRDLCESARKASGRERFLVSIDHEGGRVHRLSPPITHFPAAAQWGEETGAVVAAMAAELRALGCSLSFFPVLDIHSEATNPVIGERAFGSDPVAVADAGVIAVRTLADQGILSCGKHFPGHGATTADSHHQLPVLTSTVEEIRARELIPFRAAIAAGVPMIMGAHVVYTAIDPDFPGTFSRAVLTDLLRGELGFEGVAITDDLEMKALAPATSEERAIRAVGAGADILLEGNPATEVPLVVAHRMACALRSAVNLGTLSKERVQEACTRVEHLLARPELDRVVSRTEPDFSRHAALAAKLRSESATV